MGRFPETTVTSPWNGPDPVLHISHGGRAEPSYNRKLKAQVADPANTHVVREVRTGLLRDHLITAQPWTTIGTYSRTFLEDCIDRAETQYKQLEAFGIAIPDHEFAIASDNLGRERVLARIAIIEGEPCSPRSDNAVARLACRAGIGFAPAAVRQKLRSDLINYQQTVNAYERPADISFENLNDYVHGVPREITLPEQTVPQTYLVDLEPLSLATTVQMQ